MSDAVESPKSPLLVSIAVSLAAFMEVLDTTIANVALSNIAGAIGATSEESTWVLTSYLVSNGIVLPLSGWFSNLMGRKNFFIFCILGFTLTSFLCGISTSLPMLIVFRLLQGLTGGGLQPTQQAIIKDSFPPEKLGMAFAITGITTVLAPILGPVLGGYITDNFSWRWIFFMNVPVGLIAAYLVNILVVDTPESKRQDTGPVDYIGLSLIALGLGALQIVLDKGQQEDWFDSSFIVSFSCISAIGLLLAVYWLLKQKNPVIELKLFKIPSFNMSCWMIFFVGFALYSSATILPMLVQMNFGYNATLSGFVLSPSGVTSILLMPIVGKLVSNVQAKYLIAFGMLLNALGMLATGFITPQTDYFTFTVVRILQTIGLPFLFVSCGTLAFSKISAENSSNASAIFCLMRNLGGSVGISLATSLITHCQQIEQSNLVQHLTNADPGYQSTLASYTQKIMNLGVPSAQAANSAMGQIYKELIHQASILAYRDVYNLLALLLMGVAVIALFMPGNKLHKKNASA
ncbi:MAG: DHA2 family efflux MFS transporter permease subunit [Pelosinus sp.]|nr:DHA2 family efflux MFS transporter permease subunit [Pelosinus sp.]